MSRKTRFGCRGNVISPLMQRLWSSRNHFLKSAQNCDLETTLKPFALRDMIKSGSSLGLNVFFLSDTIFKMINSRDSKTVFNRDRPFSPYVHKGGGGGGGWGALGITYTMVFNVFLQLHG